MPSRQPNNFLKRKLLPPLIAAGAGRFAMLLLLEGEAIRLPRDAVPCGRQALIIAAAAAGAGRFTDSCISTGIASTTTTAVALIAAASVGRFAVAVLLSLTIRIDAVAVGVLGENTIRRFAACTTAIFFLLLLLFLCVVVGHYRRPCC